MAENHPFRAGQSYHREQLAEFVGSGEKQKGIIYGPKQEGVIIITSGGRHSKSSGYEDTQHEDGSWTYYGQGKSGDQNPAGKANAMLVSGQKSILLFETREPSAVEARKQGSYKKRYVFKGDFIPDGYDLFRPEQGPRKGLLTIRVKLIPADEATDEPIAPGAQKPEDRIELRQRILSRQEGAEKTITRKQTSSVFERDREIRAYALLRAGGKCEYCEKDAPFIKKDGKPFLEVHHILRLADFGDDKIENVIGICPNCHREAHYGFESSVIQKVMLLKVQSKENKG
jgi:5-methylcytosine-specific restriction protein A